VELTDGLFQQPVNTSEGETRLMEWFSRWNSFVLELLAQAGVAEDKRAAIALAIFCALVILAGVLAGVLLMRLAGRLGAPPSVEEEPESPETLSQVPVEEAPVQHEEAPAPVEEAPALVEEVPAPEREEFAPPEEAVVSESEPSILEVPAPVEETPDRITLFERVRAGLAKTQASLIGRIDSLLRGSSIIDEDLLEELEEVLVTADFGMKTTADLMQALEKRIDGGEADSPEALRDILKDEIHQRLTLEAAPLDFGSASPFVIMVVGVNGVGKTTTIGKLAHQFVRQGKSVLLGAGDTFRAAAAEQLAVWGERAGVDIIRQDSGSDPAAVAFDAVKAAIARQVDVLILDTAGRLHTKVNLMEELKKIRRVLDRELSGAPHETLLVIDATTGQNALVQARLFQEAVAVSGVALTKLDGTARGGMLVAIGNELGLPVRYVGIGEGIDDLRPFDPSLFVEALFASQQG
jgi:fused signal recognition particle receptor